KFLSTDLTARLVPTRESEAAGALDPSQADRMRRELVDWAKGRLAEQGADFSSAAPRMEQTRLDGHYAARPPLELGRLDPRWEAVGSDEDEDEDDEAASPAFDGASAVHRFDAAAPFPARAPAALQLHNRYLITESDDGMVVIDQHALHERILYEFLRER